jgi:hypothetical protein
MTYKEFKDCVDSLGIIDETELGYIDLAPLYNTQQDIFTDKLVNHLLFNSITYCETVVA